MLRKGTACLRRTCRLVATATALVGIAAAVGSTSAAASNPVPVASEVKFSPCQIEDLTGVAVYKAECTDFAVPENPDAPQGRQILLRIARVPAVNRRKAPDPLFLLAGGPGMGAILLYGNAAPAFSRVHRNRDIVLVDQRGTGDSNPLNCEFDDVDLMSASEARIVEESQRCLQTLSDRADVAFYTTSVAVRDLDRVREALGYERINLYGGSYGTRVAEHYLRRYPERTRTVILDGVVAPQQILGPDVALDAEKALRNVLERCADDRACAERFIDPMETYRALRASLEARPVAVTLPEPTTGALMTLQFGPLHLATVLRLSTYNPEQAALLPLALDLAQRENDFVPLAAQFVLTTHTLNSVMAYGMHNAVVCTEDVPFFGTQRIDRAALEATFLGTTPVDSLVSVCKNWPRGPMDDDLHAPLESRVPVLLLSGGNDPVTPAANAELTRKGLPNSLHLVLADLGHGQIGAPCMDGVVSDFIATGSIEGLDTGCTERARPMPFFTTLTGPTP